MATTPKKTVVTKTVTKKKAKLVVPKRPTPKFLVPFVSFGEYFKGAWYELRQVRWPNRKATWSLTGAVLLFTGFFVVLILLLDVLFKFIFEQILK
ncbi:MAG: secE [Candidatus Saccharibacteria bacterium]|nr:secE [Candidatus Saccharibacteria bacterium]